MMQFFMMQFLYYLEIFGFLLIILFFLKLFFEDFTFYYKNGWDWDQKNQNDFFYYGDGESIDENQKMNGKARLFAYPIFVFLFVGILLGFVGYLK